MCHFGFQVGGVPAVLKYLLEKGFIDGSCLTVTGALVSWAGLGWTGLGWAGLGWAGLGWAGLGSALLFSAVF